METMLNILVSRNFRYELIMKPHKKTQNFLPVQKPQNII